MCVIEIADRARKYGYIYWNSVQDDEMAQLLGRKSQVKVTFNKTDIGIKRIDWANRRISVGYRQTQDLAKDIKNFQLSLLKDGSLEVKAV